MLTVPSGKSINEIPEKKDEPNKNSNKDQNQKDSNNSDKPTVEENANPNILKLYLFDSSNEAKCLDGTPYGVYYKPGTGNGKNKIVIDFWGMNWCYSRSRESTLSSCSSRLKNWYGSSNYWRSEETYGYDFLGGEESKNKYFFNWHRFDFPYCDGVGTQGHLKDPVQYNGNLLYFRGYKNIEESIKYMFTKVDIEKVDSVVVSGCSSGGFSAFQWVQYIDDFVKQRNKNAVVYGITSGGYFINYKNIETNDNDFLLKFKELYSLVNTEMPAVNKDCVKDNMNEPYLCLIPEILMNYIKAPILMFQALYDSWQIWDVMGEKCVNDYKSLAYCNEEHKKNVIDLKNYTKNLLEKAVEKKKNLSVWSPACVFHCYGNSYRSSSMFQVRGNTIDEVIGEFLENRGEKQIVLIDEIDWPKNKPCANT